MLDLTRPVTCRLGDNGCISCFMQFHPYLNPNQKSKGRRSKACLIDNRPFTRTKTNNIPSSTTTTTTTTIIVVIGFEVVNNTMIATWSSNSL